MIEQTLSIIKPDGVERNLIGNIFQIYESNGLIIKAILMKLLSLTEAEGFYAIHAGKPFFDELTTYMSRSKVVISVLEGNEAVDAHRGLLGATDPQKAESGTIRRVYGKSIGENTVHGSDSADNARIEIAYFFSKSQLI